MKDNNELRKERKRLRRKRDIHYATVLGCLFAVATTIVYFSVPGAAKGAEESFDDANNDGYVPDSGNGDGLTPGQKFANNLTGLQGLNANLKVNVSYPKNKFSLDSTIAFSMPELALDKIGLNFKSNISYNGAAVTVNDGAKADTLDIDMLNGDLFVSLMGVNYKSQVSTRVEFFQSLVRIFNISLDDDTSTSSLSSLTQGDTMTKFTSALSNMKEEDLANGTYRFTITVDSFVLVMTADKDCQLTGAYTLDESPLVFGDWSIGFNLSDVVVTSDITIVNPETLGKQYLELNDQVALIEKLYNVYQQKNIGVSFEASLVNGTADESLKGAINADFSGASFYDDYLDLSLASKYSYYLKSTDTEKTSDSQSLAAVYTPEAAYLTYNDNALKAKLSHSAMTDLIDNMKSKFGKTETKSASTAFDFITTSPLMSDIYDGHYEEVLNMLKKISTANNQISLTVSLNSLGLGADSEVTVTIDGNASASPIDLASISVRNLVLSSDVTLSSATFKTTKYSTDNIEAAKAGTGYLSLDFANGVFNQCYDLFNQQKFGLTINSASTGTNGTTIVETGTANQFVLSGSAQADIKNKVGTGHINVVQSSSKWASSTTAIHDITADMTQGSDSDPAKLLFSYSNKLEGDDKPLNGSLAVSSITDIVDQVKAVFSPDAPDQRWAKFFDSMKTQAAATVIGRVVKKDYGALLESKILKSLTNVHNAKTGYDELKLVIDGHLIGSDGHDITAYLPLGASAANTDEIKGLRLEDFVYSKYTINLDLSLNSYNDLKVTQLTEDSSYLGLNSLKTLVKFGIKTSYLTSFHLTATMTLKALLNIKIDVPVDFYLSVVDKTVKVSGHFNKIPVIPALNNPANAFVAAMDFTAGAYRNVDFFYQAPANGGNGGNIYLHEYLHRPLSGDRTTYKKVYAPYFVDNMLYYIMNDVVGMKSGIIDSIQAKSDAGSKSPIAIENVLTGFSFTDGATPSWDVSLDMATLANNTQLGALKLTIGTNSDGYLASAYVNMSFNLGVSLSIEGTVNNVDIGKDNWTGLALAETAWNEMMARTSFDAVEGY